MKRMLPVALATAVLFPTGLARADAGTAQALFDDGKRLMQAGKLDEACPKLQKSFEVDPAGGTLIHLASCLEQAGKLASAWVRYNEALSMAMRDRRQDREDVARGKVAELGPKLARLHIVVPEASRVPGLTIQRGSETIPEDLWGTPAPVDVGKYDIVATAPGYKTVKAQARVDKDGEEVKFDVGKLEPEAARGAPAAAVPAPPPVTKPAASQGASSRSNRLGCGLLIGGGVVAIAGGVTGFLAISKKSDADTHCKLGSGQNQCDKHGIDASNQSRLFGNVSTVLVAAGVVAAGVGLYVTLKSPSGEPVGTLYPLVSPDRAGVGVRAVF